MMEDFGGMRVVVMGLGRFGGGIGVTRWLSNQGAKVHVTDLATEDDLGESLAALAGLDITTRLGGHDGLDLNGCDLLVVNPAVDKRKASFFKTAVDRGIPWTSEMNLFIERCPVKTIGVTGTVGKSTTTAMIGVILDAASATAVWQHGKVWLGGNIGKSLLDDLPEMTAGDLVVLELSSFQLEDLEELRKSPQISLVTNVRDNHLDRHGTLAAYARAKANIYKYQRADDWLILPFACGVELLPSDWEDRPRLCRFGVNEQTRELRLEMSRDPESSVVESVEVPLSVPGVHNLYNAAAASAVSRIVGVSNEISVEALAQFEGLPHRLEFVRELAGVRFYNDSKATTPDAAITSLNAFDRPVVAMVGGSDKGSSFAELGRVLADRAKAVICMGATSEQIRREILPPNGTATGQRVERVSTFQDAVDIAHRLAEPGDVVLLSPGCASFDWFKNYEERGETFKELVAALK